MKKKINRENDGTHKIIAIIAINVKNTEQKQSKKERKLIQQAMNHTILASFSSARETTLISTVTSTGLP